MFHVERRIAPPESGPSSRRRHPGAHRLRGLHGRRWQTAVGLTSRGIWRDTRRSGVPYWLREQWLFGPDPLHPQAAHRPVDTRAAGSAVSNLVQYHWHVDGSSRPVNGRSDQRQCRRQPCAWRS